MVGYYFTPDTKILIKNELGEILLDRNYQTDNNYFTLPDSQIITSNNITLLEKKEPDFSILAELFKIMPPDRKHNIDNITIKGSFEEDCKACTIPALQQIFYNPDFMKSLKSKAAKKIVMYHELGHFFYTEESKADFFGATVLVILGFPLYTIMKAARESLDLKPQNIVRLENLLNYLKQFNQ